jgi:heparin binding hemagglutinin HbhA
VINMPVSLPTAADYRKAREQAVKTAAERAEAARTPLLAVLGAGEYAVTTAQKAVADARARSQARREEVQSRVTELPARLNGEEVRRAVAAWREQAEQAYAEFAERGEQAWGRIRTQPQVKNAIATIEAYTEQLDARVDAMVDDAHDAAEKALATVTRQTRSTGEKVAVRTERVATQAAEAVSEASKDVSDRVAEAGAEVAHDITEAGDEAAHTTRSTSRRAANRTAPKAATRKPAARRTNGSSSS